MIPEKEKIKISKFLSLVLRHQPELIDLQLDSAGWARVDSLLEKINKSGIRIDLVSLQEIVSTNDKKRFAFNETGDMIRASQGHSLEVDLQYQEETPPEILYHGTGQKYLDSIMANGLSKQQRHHVHLSADRITALKVGQRHGKPVVLVIRAAEMHKSDFVFYRSENGVWLTDHLPVEFISVTIE